MLATHALEEKITFPQTIYFHGVCPPEGTFTINFIDENGVTLLHLSFRIDESALVINENLSGQWGDEIVVPDVSFPVGRPIALRFDFVAGNKVAVAFEDRPLCAFNWRTDLRNAIRVDTTDIDFEISRKTISPQSRPQSGALQFRPASQPATDRGAGEASTADPATADDASPTQLLQRLHELRRDDTEHRSVLLSRLDSLTETVADLQNQTLGIAASLQALITHDVMTHMSASAPNQQEASSPTTAETPAAPGDHTVEDLFVEGWGAWHYHQRTKLGELGLFIIEQDRSTPGIERDIVAVEPSSFYEFAITGTFQVSARKLYLSAYDPDNELYLTPARYVDIESGTARSLFMTTGRTQRVVLRVLVDVPAVGDECRLESARLTCQGRAELYTPPSTSEESEDKVVASMATVPGREEMLIDSVLSLYPFVDRVRVYLNGHSSVPEGLDLPRVELVHSDSHGDNGDAGKFHWCEDTEFPIKLVCDDDLIYPADYVQSMVAALKHYDNRAIVGVHGITLKQPTPSYYDEDFRHVCRFIHANEADYQAHVLGTGTVIYDSRTFKIRRADLQYRNMADVWVTELAQAQRIPMMCIARPRNWIMPNSVKDGVPTIYDASHGTDGSEFDTGKLQSAVVRSLWPLSFQPVRQAGEKRLKVVMSITTWNRVDYLQECIESFMTTRSSNYDWVLIVADDGSEDGTLKYLNTLKLQVELHVIRNKSRAACGQTNTIFELSEKIGYDFGFKIDDDVIFVKPGWDDLYIQAAQASGYPHLCHSNWKAFTTLRRRTQPDFNPPPPHVDASDKCESIVDVWACHGCLFTFTPEVIEKVGYCDEPNFPIRGQWHIDYSIRACRAGLNDPNHFYDARDANQYIDLQENKPTYRCSLPWGTEYKKTKDPEELERRLRVMRDESRIYLPLPTRSFRSLPPVHTRKTVNAFFQNVYVLNLDRHEERLAFVDKQMKDLGIRYERYRAVDGKAKPYLDEWTEYAAQSLAVTPEGVKPVGGSKDFYQNFENRLARVPFLEEKLNHKAIRTPGAWGYIKSYIGILEDAIENEYESILILDDDALFHRDFTRLFAKTVEQLPQKWKIFQLGALQYDWGDDWIKTYSENLYLCQGSSVGSHATGIHRSVFGALLHQAKFLDLPLDVGALSHVKNTFADECFTALPNLIVQDTSESDIASSEVQQGEGQKQANIYRWNLEDYVTAASAAGRMADKPVAAEEAPSEARTA